MILSHSRGGESNPKTTIPTGDYSACSRVRDPIFEYQKEGERERERDGSQSSHGEKNKIEQENIHLRPFCYFHSRSFPHIYLLFFIFENYSAGSREAQYCCLHCLCSFWWPSM